MNQVVQDPLEAIQNKFQMLRSGLSAWRREAIVDRVAKIARFRELLLEHIDQLAITLSDENGKPIDEAKNEIKGACYRIQYFLDHSAEVLESRQVNEVDGVKEELHFEPLGVIANISAWNYPYLVGVNVFIPALIAGNAVLYKPSEYATRTGEYIQDLLHRAGVPKNVFAASFGDGQVGAAILDLDCDGYFFTGSYSTGRFIAEKVAHKLVPVSLELGGKDPVYVMDDVSDLTKAAQSIVDGVFYNNGQSCCSVERIYVHEKIYDAFLKSFVAEASKLSKDRRLTRPGQLTILQEQLQDALQQGARLELGGKVVSENPAILEPTVLTEVDHRMSVMHDESFGPIIGIQKVADDAEALKLMQDTSYGLTAAVYGADEQRARTILGQLDVGTAYFNCCDRVSPYLPWSGRNHSGLGASLSYLGVLAFVQPKAYMMRS